MEPYREENERKAAKHQQVNNNYEREQNIHLTAKKDRMRSAIMWTIYRKIMIT